MEREELIRELRNAVETEQGKTYDTFRINTRAMAQDCLDFILESMPKPDPITGLVPCGCGGVPELLESVLHGSYTDMQNEYHSYHMRIYWIECPKCGIKTTSNTPGIPIYQSPAVCPSRDKVIHVWNTAMGYRAVPDA